jgi:type I restriction enzyme, S subunit
MSFPRYPAYKDSGVEWLGEVPEHWEVLPLKRRARLLTEKTETTENPVALENIEGWTGRFVETESEFQGEGVAFQRGDILFGKLRPYLAKVYLASSQGQAVGDFHVIHPDSLFRPKYLKFQLLTKEVIDLASGSTYGAKMPRASWDFLGSLQLSIPPLNEQEVIATFLDRETAKIDALIAEQQRLIELLQEKRQAVISHAVTKGLNPNAPMKASGVEWLGEVPEHWNILPVWMLFFIGRGRVISHEDIASSPGDYPVYSSQTEQDGEMGRIDTFDFEGDYLTWTTDGANAGSVFRRAGRFNCTNVCGTLKSKPNALVILEFAVQSLRLATASFVRMDINPKLMNNVMASIKIPVPPLEEQQSIALHISQHTEEFEPLKAAIDIQLQLLKERRSALISAAVTGQIDVRGLVTEEGEQ